jgi:hypothetical protein
MVPPPRTGRICEEGEGGRERWGKGSVRGSGWAYITLRAEADRRRQRRWRRCRCRCGLRSNTTGPFFSCRGPFDITSQVPELACLFLFVVDPSARMCMRVSVCKCTTRLRESKREGERENLCVVQSESQKGCETKTQDCGGRQRGYEWSMREGAALPRSSGTARPIQWEGTGPGCFFP